MLLGATCYAGRMHAICHHATPRGHSLRRLGTVHVTSPHTCTATLHAAAVHCQPSCMAVTLQVACGTAPHSSHRAIMGSPRAESAVVQYHTCCIAHARARQTLHGAHLRTPPASACTRGGWLPRRGPTAKLAPCKAPQRSPRPAANPPKASTRRAAPWPHRGHLHEAPCMQGTAERQPSPDHNMDAPGSWGLQQPTACTNCSWRHAVSASRVARAVAPAAAACADCCCRYHVTPTRLNHGATHTRNTPGRGTPAQHT